MRQEIPAQNSQPEHSPAEYIGRLERMPNLLDSTMTNENLSERNEQVSEDKAAFSELNLTTTLPMPVADSSAADVPIADASNPPVAADDDLIEAEWVKKAKKIVSETRDDPHRQENEVNKLQVDYRKKRYREGLGVA